MNADWADVRGFKRKGSSVILMGDYFYGEANSPRSWGEGPAFSECFNLPPSPNPPLAPPCKAHRTTQMLVEKNIILAQRLPMPWTGRELAGVRPKEFVAQVLLTCEARILLTMRSCESFRSNEEGPMEDPFS